MDKTITRGRPRTIWTESMITRFYAMRAAKRSLLECAKALGVSYPTAQAKAVELGLNDPSKDIKDQFNNYWRDEVFHGNIRKLYPTARGNGDGVRDTDIEAGRFVVFTDDIEEEVGIDLERHFNDAVGLGLDPEEEDDDKIYNDQLPDAWVIDAVGGPHPEWNDPEDPERDEVWKSITMIFQDGCRNRFEPDRALPWLDELAWELAEKTNDAWALFAVIADEWGNELYKMRIDGESYRDAVDGFRRRAALAEKDIAGSL